MAGCHSKQANVVESCNRSYILCPEAGVTDGTSIMIRKAEDLSQDWYEKYDADAFVNAWDFTNYHEHLNIRIGMRLVMSRHCASK